MAVYKLRAMDYLEVLIKLRKIIRSINLESKRIEKNYSLSIPQLLALQYLQEQEQYQSTASQMKSFLKLNASTISGIISRLEHKNLVAKIPNAQDRRKTQIALTERGMRILKNAPTTLFEKLSTELSNLSVGQIENLQKNIDFLVRAMDAEDIDAAPILTNEEFSTENNSN